MPITDISIGPKSVEQSIQADCIGKIFLKHPGMLRCRRGVLLITIEGDALDYQLTEGSELLLPSRRLCLVEGGGTFVLGLEPRGCRESIKKMKNSILPSGKGLIPTQGNALVVLLITLLFVASQANLVLILTQLHPSIFSIQLSFTADAFWRVIEQWGASGLAIYRSHFLFDNVHLFIYGAFGYLVVSKTSLFVSMKPVLYRLIRLMLPVSALFDLAENAAQLYLLSQPPGFHSPLIPVSAVCSVLKWVLVSLFALLVAVPVIRKLWANITAYRAV
ncbi:MAG: hypothetical protein RLZZ298_2893 [Pseudomonadota bacterium]